MPDLRINNTPSADFSEPPQTPRCGPPAVFMPELKDQALQAAFPQLNTAAGMAATDPLDDLSPVQEDDSSGDEDDSVDDTSSGDLTSLLFPIPPSGDTWTAGAATVPSPMASGSRVAGAPADDDTLGLDALAANLASLGNDDGIFEVTMPDGQHLGVAVNVQPSGVRFLMSPSDGTLRDRIKTCRMELKGAVEQRIHKDVEIAVL